MWDKSDRVLGVLGGMGPLATQFFYRMLIEKTNASCDQEHLDMIILNHATMPDRTEAILSGNSKNLYERLLKDIRCLEYGGVAAIAIPCNTSHIFVDSLQKEVSVPIIHMVRETVGCLSDMHRNINTVGILATDGTIKSGIYQIECERVGIRPIVPSPSAQKHIMDIIYSGIKKGKSIDEEGFLTVERELIGQGCQSVILGCTELSVFNDNCRLLGHYIDALEVLAEKSVSACGKTVNKNRGWR